MCCCSAARRRRRLEEEWCREKPDADQQRLTRAQEPDPSLDCPMPLCRTVSGVLFRSFPPFLARLSSFSPLPFLSDRSWFFHLPSSSQPVSRYRSILDCELISFFPSSTRLDFVFFFFSLDRNSSCICRWAELPFFFFFLADLWVLVWS
jgi:hypothetical protein